MGPVGIVQSILNERLSELKSFQRRLIKKDAFYHQPPQLMKKVTFLNRFQNNQVRLCWLLA
jgi:hypothetical protein